MRKSLGLLSLLVCAVIAILVFVRSEKPPIRVAIIGGMTSTGMWQELAAKFEKDTGWKTILVVTGPKPMLTAPFKRGEIDLLTMHEGIEATDLAANGFGNDLRPWMRNEHTIIGPPSDPAGIRAWAST